MKIKFSFFTLIILLMMGSCSSDTEKTTSGGTTDSGVSGQTGQSGVKDDMSNPNIVQVASKSPDHTTLVTAVQAAGLVDALSNAGPFTVFAPTNEAFNKLPAGTVEGLLKEEKKNDLKGILEYHTYVGVLKTEYMSDGQMFEEVSGQKIKITKKGDKVFVNDTAEIVATITTSNGIIHVINEVLLPK
jgi:uncharacterized surface protein with fasciclin (FAS1) repeats